MQPTRDWDDTFANMAHIPGASALPGLWAARSAAFRASGVRVTYDMPYGQQPREMFDLIWPEGPPQGLAVFVHGGYWMSTDKSLWTHLAMGAVARGWAVCLPGYMLAPAARISTITRQVARAIMAAAACVDGPVRLAGHSAGGHLVTRMICEDSPLGAPVLGRVAHTLSISGLHDLRPLLHTKMNDTLGLTRDEASAESPALLMPASAPALTCWVGGGERPEFIRQAQVMAQLWDGLGAICRCQIDGSHHHFSVLDGLADPDSPITAAFVGSDQPALKPSR